MLANKLGGETGCKTKIIPYVMTWDGVVSKYHKGCSRDIGITESVEVYIQTVVLKKTLESISFERRHGTCQEEVTWDNPVRLSSGRGVVGMPSDCPGQVIQV